MTKLKKKKKIHKVLDMSLYKLHVHICIRCVRYTYLTISKLLKKSEYTFKNTTYLTHKHIMCQHM
jgi:hypothetical protein